jgi:hypothetical protein
MEADQHVTIHGKAVRLTMLRLLRACDDSHLPVVQAGNLGVLLGVSAELRRVTLLVR